MSRVARAALLGLAGGLALGAVALGSSALGNLRTAGAPCPAPAAPARSAQECALDAELGAQLGRLQGLGALGLGLVAAGLGVALGRR